LVKNKYKRLKQRQIVNYDKYNPLQLIQESLDN
jgi:hypothetical protein